MLPITYGDHQAKILCKLDYDFSEADETKFKMKNSRWWNRKETYMRVDYEVKILIGAADITFELCELLENSSFIIFAQANHNCRV